MEVSQAVLGGRRQADEVQSPAGCSSYLFVILLPGSGAGMDSWGLLTSLLSLQVREHGLKTPSGWLLSLTSGFYMHTFACVTVHTWTCLTASFTRSFFSTLL